MCKSRSSTNVIDRKSPRSRTTRASNTTASSSSVDPSANFTSYNITNSRSSYKDSSKSSISSAASLSSLKDSLPESALIYEFSEISAATNNFLSKQFSSGSWRCSIRAKDVIVFMRKLRRPIELLDLKRRLSIICRSHHVSLVKLLGASISGNYIYLVYDFVAGANLAECLRNPRNPNFTVLSSWLSRIQIAADIAHGLDYIHHCSGLNSKFVHNHIKSSSILVAEATLTPKICHFGTAELCGEVISEDDGEPEIAPLKQAKRSNSNKMKLEGTRGYMAPEFRSNGSATQKSDVYAFGVVVLELISGDEALKYTLEDGNNGGYARVSVIETARRAVENGLRTWVDRRLRDSFPVEVAEKMVVLGLECVEELPEKRPDMGRVAGVLSKLYLESTKWAEGMRLPVDMSVSIAPR